ncbi:alpha/beta hydrolase [Methylocapsa acidiphila]|uniref:alpha/beta hydrolase n=1 Tax=Methylocapsa acidiphila TaxID=133552 RepID=UPI000405D4A8|nr:alpha/beta fold hydrolase [Methylocapsa acidiphila]
MAIDLEGPSCAPLSCGKAVYLVVLLHGRGANGDDIIDLALNWQPILPKAEFLALNAPFPCDPAPRGRQWFDVESPETMLAALRAAADMLDRALDELMARRRLEPSHLALVGFSQGATLALHAGLRRKERIGAIVAFSGALHGAEALNAEIRSRPPVLLVHGEADAVVPFTALDMARAALEAAQAPVTAIARPKLGHAIDDESVSAAGEFLLGALKTRKAASEEAH